MNAETVQPVAEHTGAACTQRSATAAPPSGAVLARSFFARHAPVVARELVGMILYRTDSGAAARIVETEAYTEDDPACHAYGRRTQRNAPLWGPPGHSYVYRSYGMHWCFNTATGAVGAAQGCLIRAAEPLDRLEWMRAHRPVADDVDLLRGPAKLCQAFAITGDLSGTDVCGAGERQRAGGRGPEGAGERQRAGGRGPEGAGVLRFLDDGTRPQVVTGPRVGVSRAADLPWRFLVADSVWVSPYRRSPRAPRRSR